MTFGSIIKPLLEFLKQPLYSVAFGVVTAFVLLSPNSIIDRFGLLKYRNEGKPYIGGFFLFCVGVALASGIRAGIRQYDRYSFFRSGKKRLHRLTVEEKQILRAYIEGQTRSLHLNVTSGVVNGLEQETIIYRSSNLGHLMSGFAYNIQPWAWDYLNEHRDLLGP